MKAPLFRAICQMSTRRIAPPLSGQQWTELLALSDRTQMTLHLRGTEGLPAWVDCEIATRLERNAQRRLRLRDAFQEIARALKTEGVEFVLLKGFTHETGFGIDAAERVQYDLDLLCPDASRATRVLHALGYVPHSHVSLSDEHAPPLVRAPRENRAWRWREDYFDPEMPIGVEVHPNVWNPARERIALMGLDGFWSRRRVLDVNRLRVPSFAEPDRLAFAALHALRHILRNDARPAHVYELARFLETRAQDAPFWEQWLIAHDGDLRALQAVAFFFARAWFGCTLPMAVERDVASLPRSIALWFEEYAWSPMVNLSRPNKDVVWLHIALLKNRRDKLSVLGARLAPLRFPHREEARVYSRRLAGRARYHLFAFASALTSGARWGWRTRNGWRARKAGKEERRTLTQVSEDAATVRSAGSHPEAARSMASQSSD